jgi:DNA-directed RNA polymerase specialized sigma24 family protein
MSSPTRGETPSALAADYLTLRPKVTGFLAGRYPQLDAEACADIYQDAWVALLEALARGGVAREKWISYLLSTARNRGAGTLRCADRRRRTSLDASDLADRVRDRSVETPEERVVALDTGRELLARLSDGERAVAAYRLVLRYDKREVCRELGLSPRAYKRRVDKAAVKVRAFATGGHAGGVSAPQELVLRRCLSGPATPQIRTAARRLVNTAAGRARVAQLRGLGAPNGQHGAAPPQRDVPGKRSSSSAALGTRPLDAGGSSAPRRRARRKPTRSALDSPAPARSGHVR